MKKQILFIYLLVLSLSSFSQYDFKKGFVVTGGDTIRGYIDYTGPNTNSNYCFFRKDSLDNITKYTAADIDAFGITDARLFVRKTVTIEKKEETIFLEYLVNGIVDLYYCKRVSKDFYFIEKDGTLYPLENKDVPVTVNNQKMIKESNEYVGILAWLMSDAQEMRSEIYETRLNHNSLIKLSKDYHNQVCKDEECIVYFKKQKSLNDAKWHFDVGIVVDYIMAGMKLDVSINSYSNLFAEDFYNTNTGKYERVEKWITHSYITETNAKFNSFLSGYSPGMFLNLNRNGRFSFQVQLKYQHLKNARIEIERFQMPFLMSYDFMRYSRVSPYMIVGVCHDFITQFNAVTPFYAKYNHLTDVTKDNVNMTFIPVYSERVIEYEEKNFLPHKYYPVIMAGTGIGFELRNHKTIKFELTGSYNYFKSKGTSSYKSIMSIVGIVFSLKYAL